jgi:hypothetical protein
LLLKHFPAGPEIFVFLSGRRWINRLMDDRASVGDMWTFVAMDADTKLVPPIALVSAGRPMPQSL